VAKCVALSLAVLEVGGSNPAPACSCVSVFSSTLSCGMRIPKRCNLLRLKSKVKCVTRGCAGQGPASSLDHRVLLQFQSGNGSSRSNNLEVK
jgi:hypothetical protein